MTLSRSLLPYPKISSRKFFDPSDAPRAVPLDQKFAQEHDERISFGHRARVQQPARARNQQSGRLPGRHPMRAHASNKNRCAHPAKSQNSDRACMHSVSWIHARAGGWVAAHSMVWARLPGRRGLPNRFEKSADHKLKCAHQLRSSGSARARTP